MSETKSRSPRLSRGGARMVDVARRAGTSTQTVSRVLSRPELVSEATRVLVEKAVRELNYIPNSAARLLASTTSRIVAVIIPSLSATVYAREVDQIIRVLEPASFSVMIGHSDYSERREERLIQSFLERRPDGFILTGTQHTDLARELLKNSGVPVVETFDGDNDAMDISVGFSNYEAGRKVGDLFRSRGLTRIAYVGGRIEQDFRSNARFDGLDSRLREDGLAPVARIQLKLPMSARDGVAGLDQVLDVDPLTQAIFFSADALAISALLECNRRGVRVPEQMALCGFGNYDLADATMPALTTVAVPFETIGELAATAILDRINDRVKEPRRITLPLQLLRRGSA
ncbi:LacI family DNA-binding transcriptional regulator [Neorhizobium sp. T786]|uniref:LacI family DNA-binding transcriptional regulator n=1 Tax=Pseudorhizobium xiangyangii TaxID=2883104 RepID=UPI001CFF62AE|nr:LacI family DNA-binding transcriptional regulator [Neorhizobium xiangyangii]MCB5202583.1 LacI family DNA-binding transcriptional regulator [Neorhizobium xiangyangii]